MMDVSAFRRALLDPTAPPPAGLGIHAGADLGSRFDIYRNNITVSLTEALAVGFPLVRMLVGAENFALLARAFVQSHPPRSPVLMFYGSDFPPFLGGFKETAKIGYLPDAARLDLAMRDCYHAADAVALTAADLENVAVTDLPDLRLSLAPSTHILRSRWPLFDIWRYNFDVDAPKPRAIAQNVLITRPEFDPALHPLDDGTALWLSHIEQGNPLGAATDRTAAKFPDFDLAETLAAMLRTRALRLVGDQSQTS